MGGPRSWRRVLRGGLVGLGGAALALALWLPGLLENLEARTWDLRERAFARPAPTSSQIALILVDQESFDFVNREMALTWPWPREIIAQVVDFCRLAGARALVLDVLYTEPSPNGVEDDALFAKSVADYGSVVGALHLAKGEGTATAWPADVPRPVLAVQGLQGWLAAGPGEGIQFQRATFPIPELGSAIRMLGNDNMTPDRDTKYRRTPLFAVFDGAPVPAIGLAALIAGSTVEPPISISPRVLTVGGVSVPIDRSGKAILRFRGPSRTYHPWRAAAIIRSAIQLASGEQPDVALEELRDKYVFFGYSAPGLLDLRPSPMAGAYSGVEVHATMLDNLLAGDFLRDVPLAAGIPLLLVLCIGAGIAASSVSGLLGNALVYVALLPVAPAAALGAYALGGWLQVVALEVGTVVTLVASSIANYATEGRQKRFIKGAFKQYLSPAVIEQIIANPERLRLGGERRQLSIFFSDLQGFTSLSEGLSPEELTAVLNEYLSAMTDIIQEEGGTIDKYEGDAIIAFWNAPLEQADHTVRAVRGALRCQEKLAAMRPAFRQRVGKDLLMRIGLNTGPAVVGNMGSRTRFDYTMLGDAVNLASRLEGVNKQFRTFTMVSQAVVDSLGGAFPTRELSRIAVVGRKEPVVVHEPMTAEQFASRRALLERFDRGLRAYYDGRFVEAEQLFAEAATEDPAAGAYAERCRDLTAHPPAGPWAGVWVMTSK